MIRLETPRLLLRRFQASDLEAFFAYRNDPAVARWQSWSGIGKDEAATFIAEMASATLGVPGKWFQIAVAERSSGDLIGDCAVRVSAADPGVAEIGFTLAGERQGQGYAREAVSRLIDHLFGSMALERVIADTDPDNERSWRLLERLGMRRAEHLVRSLWFKGRWADELLYEMRREEWLASR